MVCKTITGAFIYLSISYVLAIGTASSSTDTPFSSQYSSLPWWEDPRIVPNKELVSDDYDWENRDTGTEFEWQSNLALWSHFNISELSKSPLESWTEGFMTKHLRQINDTAFQLHSIYEKAAIGGWMDKGLSMNKRDSDGLLEHSYVFCKTPNRVTTIPPPLQRMPQHWPDEVYTTRVTTVMPSAATISCPRWLPNDIDQSEELFHGDDYSRFQFAELWLKVKDDNPDRPDKNNKVGLFVEYDGITGKLKQVFVMRQTSLTPDLKADLPYSNRKSTDKNPATLKWDFSNIVNNMKSKGRWPPPPIKENAASKAFVPSTSIPAFLEKRRWTHLRNARVAQTNSPAGQSRAATLHSRDDCSFCCPIKDVNKDIYFDERCHDGLYFVIPKTFHPTHLSEDVLIELGYVSEHSLRRVFITGKRSQSSLDTCVYEEWTSKS